jgi:hypothetical protein
MAKGLFGASSSIAKCTTRNSIMLQRGYIVKKSYQVRQLPPFSRNFQAK